MSSKKQPAHTPWLSIWIHPRQTLQALLTQRPVWMIHWIAAISGILGGLLAAFIYGIDLNPATGARVFGNWAVIFVLGAGLSLAYLYLLGWLLGLTGRWIGGTGSFSDLRCAVGWSFYPSVVTLLLALLSLVTTSLPWLSSLLGFAAFIALIWGIVLYIFLIAQAHTFSVWKAIGALLLTTVLIWAVQMVIALLVPLLSPLWD